MEFGSMERAATEAGSVEPPDAMRYGNQDQSLWIERKVEIHSGQNFTRKSIKGSVERQERTCG